MSAQPDLPIGKQSKHFAIYMPAFIVGLLLFTLLGLVAYYAAWHVSFSQVAAIKREALLEEQQEARNERKARRAQQDAVITSAAAQDNDLLLQISQTTNSLFKAHATLTKIEAEVVALKTNSYGALVAQQPDLVGFMMKCFDTAQGTSPNLVVFINKIETAKREQIDLNDAIGSAVFPSTDLKTAVERELAWATEKESGLVELDTAIAGIVREARARVSFAPKPQSTQTLADAIQVRRSSMTEIPTFSLAPPSAAAQGEPAQSYQWIADTIGDSSKSLQDKALDPRVQQALAPFLTPGTFRPEFKNSGVIPPTVDGAPHPLSLTWLRRLGALNADESGLLKFMDIATDLSDSRPRYPRAFAQMNWNDDVNLRTEAAMLQTLLKLLGPTYVDLGMLQP